MSDNLMDLAIAEAYASCPVDDGVILYTLEFLHSTLEQPGRIVRWPVTSNELEKFSLCLEADAPLNAGEYVNFVAVPFEVTIPAQEENAPGEFKIKIENIGPVITETLISAVKQREPARIIFREYLKSMPENPQIVYTDFSIAKVTVNNNGIEATASMIDWLLRPYGKIYTPTGFPGLVRGR